MDILGTEQRLVEFDEPDMGDMLNHDMFGSPCDLPTGDAYMDNDWLNSLFEDPVLNDKMITEAVQSPRIQSEHSYSMHNDPAIISPFGLAKLDDLNDDMETEFFDSPSPLDLSQKTCNIASNMVTIKKETAIEDFVFNQSSLLTQHTSLGLSNHRQPTIILANQPSTPLYQHRQERLVLPKSIKIEPADLLDQHSNDESGLDLLDLPPTPPSSSSSDSEGGQSPLRSAPSSPLRESPSKHHSLSKAFSQPLFTSPIPTSGILILSEEEKRTLISEGYPIPSKLPLTKQEEKNLKKIRRKIKNKISAQESRRKKKEYLETLEKRVESFTQENTDLRRKVDNLENNNRSLLGQLQKLQSLVGKVTRPSPSTTQTGTVLMVVVLCFAMFIGGWAPMSMNIGYSSVGPSDHGVLYPQPVHPSPTMGPLPKSVQVLDPYITPNKKSRVLLSMKDELEDIYGPRLPETASSQQDLEMDQLEASSIAENLHYIVEAGLLEEIRAVWDTAKSPVVTVDARLLTSNETTDPRELQAMMHPDIAAPADFLSADRLVNATAANESA